MSYTEGTRSRGSYVVGTTTQGVQIKMEIEGVEEVQRELDMLADSLRRETSVEMVTDVGNAVAEWMRENIRANFWRHPTGALEASVYAATLTNENGAVCYVGPNDATIPYVYIHEYGGDIYPVRRKFLSWIGDDGKRVFAKHVHIPARPYIAPAFNDHQEEILEIMKEDLDAAIASGCADL